MAFDAGSIVARLGMDDSGFSAGILRAQGLTSLLGSTISSFLADPLLGVASAARSAIAGVQDLVLGTAQAADQIAKLSRATGASTEWLSGMRHAAELSGTSFGAVSGSIERLVRSMSEAASGSGRSAEAFARLGVSATNADGSLRDSQSVFMAAAEALAGVTNESERAALAQELFGRGAAEIVPLLAEGADGIAAMVDEAKDLGLTFDSETAAAAEAFNDSLTRLKAGLAGAMQEAVTPIFAELADLFQTLAPIVRQLAGAIGDVLGGALKAIIPIVRVVLQVLQPLLWLIGKIAEGIGALFGAIGQGLGGAGGGSGGGGPTNVSVSVDPEASARRVADQVAPAIAGAARGVQRRTERSVAVRMDLDDYEQSLALR